MVKNRNKNRLDKYYQADWRNRNLRSACQISSILEG